MKFQDQLGREIELENTPKRIISLVPSQTELLVDLGLEESLVGITSFCVHPGHLLSTKTSVGGTKKVNLRKVKELHPDIILCNKEENTKEMVDDLMQIASVHCSNVANIEDSLELISMYGEIFKCPESSLNIISQTQLKLKVLEELVAGAPVRKVAYFIWDKPMMVAGKGTFIDEMLQLNNFQNVFEQERYPKTSAEELENMDIDLCMLSSEPYSFTSEHKKTFSQFAKGVELVNGEYFSWYGSRLIKALEYFKQFHL